MLDYPYRIAKKRIDIVKADDIAVMEPDKPQKRDCLTSFRQFFFIKKNKAFLLKISLKAFSVSD